MSASNNIKQISENKSHVYKSVFSDEYRNNICYKADKQKPDSSKEDPSQHQDAVLSSAMEKISISDNPTPNDESAKVQTTGVPENNFEASCPVATDYVGYANLPNQIYWRAAKKCFDFNLMVIGSSGLGKSTLINSMFLTDISNPATFHRLSARSRRTMCLEATKVHLRENGVDLYLTLMDTPGFGDDVNNRDCWERIISYVNRKYENYYMQESRVHRAAPQDERIHCCLYFIQPTGHGLEPLDVAVMKSLSDKVNIIPVIAKADTLTPDECHEFKVRIWNEIRAYDINIYEFPDIPEKNTDPQLHCSLKARVPFAVVGSNTIIEVNGKSVRGRKCPWGVIDIESLEHCDFMALRKMITSSHMQDLIDTTHDILYAKYRYRKLYFFNGQPITMSLVRNMEDEIHRNHLMFARAEADIEAAFREKETENKKVLKETEKMLLEEYKVARKELDREARDLEKKRRLFELEKEAWEKQIKTAAKGKMLMKRINKAFT